MLDVISVCVWERVCDYYVMNLIVFCAGCYHCVYLGKHDYWGREELVVCFSFINVCVWRWGFVRGGREGLVVRAGCIESPYRNWSKRIVLCTTPEFQIWKTGCELQKKNIFFLHIKLLLLSFLSNYHFSLFSCSFLYRNFQHFIPDMSSYQAQIK